MADKHDQGHRFQMNKEPKLLLGLHVSVGVILGWKLFGDLFEQDHCWHPQRADFKGCLSSTLLKFGTVCPKVTQMYRGSCICFFQAWLQQFTLVGLSKQIAKSSAAFFSHPWENRFPAHRSAVCFASGARSSTHHCAMYKPSLGLPPHQATALPASTCLEDLARENPSISL